MRKLVLLLGVAALIAAPAFAAQTVFYSWEDGGTILGSYGANLVGVANVTGPQTGSQGSSLPDYTCPGAVTGDRYLHLAEDPHTGTPEAFVGWIKGLNDGDQVTVGFYGYDITPGTTAFPSLRSWGAYTAADDINTYVGSASGPSTYTAGTGWDYMEYTWTFNGVTYPGDALRIGIRLYSTPTTHDPDHTDFWVDDLTIVAPDYAEVIVAPEPTSLLLLGLAGLLIRRR